MRRPLLAPRSWVTLEVSCSVGCPTVGVVEHYYPRHNAGMILGTCPWSLSRSSCWARLAARRLATEGRTKQEQNLVGMPALSLTDQLRDAW